MRFHSYLRSTNLKEAQRKIQHDYFKSLSSNIFKPFFNFVNVSELFFFWGGEEEKSAASISPYYLFSEENNLYCFTKSLRRMRNDVFNARDFIHDNEDSFFQ